MEHGGTRSVEIGTIRRWLAVLGGGVCLVLAVGCSSGSSGEGASGSDEKDDSQPAATVDLPERPPKEKFQIPARHDDGTFHVRGLIAHRHDHFESTVEVKGVVTFISEYCDPAEPEEEGETCRPAHVLVRDSERGDDQLLVVGFDHDFIDRADIEAGEEYVFEGRYQRQHDDFVVSKSGLLVLEEVGDEPVEPEDESQ